MHNMKIMMFLTCVAGGVFAMIFIFGSYLNARARGSRRLTDRPDHTAAV